MSFKNIFISIIIQILIFSIIPFFTFLITRKTYKWFFNYIGLKKSTKKANSLAIINAIIYFSLILILIISNEEVKNIFASSESITWKFSQLEFSFKNMFFLILIAFFQTAFSEEIFFRGFLAKKLIHFLGYLKGNILQAIIFWFIHSLAFAFFIKNIFAIFFIFLIPTISAYFSVYLNEKIWKSSIIPSWIFHWLSNLLTYSIIWFYIL